jgi:hypothetical protein
MHDRSITIGGGTRSDRDTSWNADLHEDNQAIVHMRR